MTSYMCEKCNHKRVIDGLFVKVDAGLHIARQTWLFPKVNSLSFGTLGVKLLGKAF